MKLCPAEERMLDSGHTASGLPVKTAVVAAAMARAQMLRCGASAADRQSVRNDLKVLHARPTRSMHLAATFYGCYLVALCNLVILNEKDWCSNLRPGERKGYLTLSFPEPQV